MILFALAAAAWHWLLQVWLQVIHDQWVGELITSGYKIELVCQPPPRFFPSRLPRSESHRQDLFNSIESLHLSRVISPVPWEERFQGFYSNFFVIPKKDGTVRPILDLKLLNRFVRVRHFRMESLRAYPPCKKSSPYVGPSESSEEIHFPNGSSFRQTDALFVLLEGRRKGCTASKSTLASVSLLAAEAYTHSPVSPNERLEEKDFTEEDIVYVSPPHLHMPEVVGHIDEVFLQHTHDKICICGAMLAPIAVPRCCEQKCGGCLKKNCFSINAPKDTFLLLRPGQCNGRTIKRKRRGGKRHHRNQKKTREKQVKTAETSSVQEEGSELVINISDKELVQDDDIIIKATDKGGAVVIMDRSKYIAEIDRQCSFKAFHSFDMLVSRDIRKYNTKNMQYLPNNLNTQERKAIKDLQTNHNIVVRPADKGGGIVILDHSMYHQESIRLLSDPITYKKLRYDPTTQYIIKLSALAYKGKSKGILDTKEYHYILNKNPSKAVFYHIPKIHKDQTHPPGRPIISGINNLTANLSRYVDVHLQKCMQLIPAYLKDTGHTLEILKEIKWNKKYILGTLDIKSLYTVINQEKGCEAAEYFLGSLGTYTQTQIQYILDCIKFILQHNYFVYEDQHYLQTWGTAMGTRFAPSYANIYVAKWEESYIISEGRLHPGLVTWRRFIDDILFIWDGPRSDLDRFIAGPNSNQYGLEFTPNISTTSINFLDLNIYVDNNQLHTKCHRKEVDSNSFIHITSCHLPVWLANVPKSQYTRIRRNCSNMVDYDREANHLTQQFMDKGYSKPLLEKAQYDVALLPRESLLKKANNSNINNIKEVDLKDQIFNLPIITQYHANHKKFVGIIRKHWAILRQDKIIGDFLPTIPKFIYKKSQSLDKILNPIARNSKSYIKDTTDFLNKLEAIQLEGEVSLASFDVISLYTSIEHSSGIRAVDKKLNICGRQRIFDKTVGNNFKAELLLIWRYLLLTTTWYGNGGQHGPAYANLVMSVLEEDLVYVSHHFRHVQKRHTEKELEDFHQYLNEIDETIKFTLISSKSNIQFLDFSIRQENGELTTTLLSKKRIKITS
ncbi:unnamed protein product [Ranitomeya imitator]|uniref:Helix-turn-helix domain-containing protein n=1 Tax=Ranitomeya imitator TaxID=111125 RepID=A0ABN9LNW6_9NEOB|nr:unnamed protein product [Ranitomeya imitator]